MKVLVKEGDNVLRTNKVGDPGDPGLKYCDSFQLRKSRSVNLP